MKQEYVNMTFTKKEIQMSKADIMLKQRTTSSS